MDKDGEFAVFNIEAQPRDILIHIHENNDSPTSLSFLRFLDRASESSCFLPAAVLFRDEIRNVWGNGGLIPLRRKSEGYNFYKYVLYYNG